MAIGVKNQYIISFDLGGNKDFITESELNEFTIIEEAGNVLPTFELEFNTDDETILPMLNESTPLSLTFGKDADTAIDIPLSVASLIQIENGKEGVTISIKGLYNAIDYITDTHINISTEKSGIEVVKDTVSKSFKPDFNIQQSTDKQKWIQHNTSNKKFVSDTILHSYKQGTFFACAITLDGKFRLRDIKQDLKRPSDAKYDYRLTMSPKLANDLAYDNDPTVTSSTGFLNNWTGYGREILEQQLDTGISTAFTEVPEPIIALTKELAKDKSVTRRSGGTQVINDNTHKDYWKAYWYNLVNLVSLSNIGITVTIDNQFYPIHPLHLIMFNMPSKTEAFSSEYLSGLYYVSKVSRTLSNKKFTTSLKLNRESINQVTNK